MTKNQLSAMIKSLLETAQNEVASAAVYDGVPGGNAWVTHMTAAKVCASLATAFMAARDSTEYPL